MVKETREVVALARRFNEEVVRPLALKLDRKTFEDPDLLPWDLVKKANEWGFYTKWIPKIFGGQGCNMPSLSHFVEELGSACLGLANVITVHYLGVSGLMMAGEAPVIMRVVGEVVEGERTGKPCLIALAITEPTAGTDVEEVDLEEKGTVTCHARRVEGGYRVSGSKVFISMGRMSQWTVLYAYNDLGKPTESPVVMMVKQGMQGFSVGGHEKKMGQRICPVSTLYFEDCFVPDDLVILDAARIKAVTNLPVRDIVMRHIDYIVSITRPAVGAFGTGAARGAFEAALRHAGETELDGKLMLNLEWVQCRLAEMFANVRLGRLAYQEANAANGHRGVYHILQMTPLYQVTRLTPKVLLKPLLAPVVRTRLGSWLLRKWYLDWQKPADQHLCTGLGSLAKFSCTDFGLRNCQMAIELMGQDGLRQDRGAEKILRDAKLLQIYEGTNQLNRLNVFKSLIAPACPQARVFED